MYYHKHVLMTVLNFLLKIRPHYSFSFKLTKCYALLLNLSNHP